MGKNVVVFAGNECREERKDYYFSLAYKTGKLLTEAGLVVITGGGPGLMNEVSRGAYEAGGKTIGICLEKQGRNQSKYLTEKLVYKLLKPRQERLRKLGDAFIALPGGIGTLYEAVEIMALKRKEEIPLSQPLILVDRYFEKIVEELRRMHKEGFITFKLDELFQYAVTPQQAVEMLNKHFSVGL